MIHKESNHSGVQTSLIVQVARPGVSDRRVAVSRRRVFPTVHSMICVFGVIKVLCHAS